MGTRAKAPAHFSREEVVDGQTWMEDETVAVSASWELRWEGKPQG